MMRFTKWGEYGLLFCVYLAKQKAVVESPISIGAAELGDSHGVPIQYAQQILHRLRKGDVIKSIRGPRGGFQLTKDPKTITMKDILTVAEGSTFEVMCESNPVFDSCSSGGTACSVKHVWRHLKNKIDEALDEMTLSEVAATEDLVTLNRKVG